MSGSGSKLPPALAWIPWWLSVIMAIASYLALKYLAPPLAISAGFPPLAGILPQLAPLAAIGFLLFAAVLLYDGDDVGSHPEDQDKQESAEDDDQNGPSTL